MDIRFLTQKNPYESFAGDSFSSFAKQDFKKQKDQVEKEDLGVQDKTEITQDNLDRLNSSGELASAASSVNERIVSALKTRLQSAESELKKLDLQMKNLSSVTQTVRGIFATQTLAPGVSGSGIAATLAELESGEIAQKSPNGGGDKVAAKEAMMKYLSVEKGIKMAEIMDIQKELARMQGF